MLESRHQEVASVYKLNFTGCLVVACLLAPAAESYKSACLVGVRPLPSWFVWCTLLGRRDFIRPHTKIEAIHVRYWEDCTWVRQPVVVYSKEIWAEVIERAPKPVEHSYGMHAGEARELPPQARALIICKINNKNSIAPHFKNSLGGAQNIHLTSL